MPKFNMSGEDAMTLVNYFGAADKLGNPGAGLTTPYLNIEQTDPKYWREPDGRVSQALAGDSPARTARGWTSGPRTC